jgi:esterase/lipase superfamily enzyme
LDLHAKAREIVERALRDTLVDSKDSPQSLWERPLAECFPDRERLTYFLQRVTAGVNSLEPEIFHLFRPDSPDIRKISRAVYALSTIDEDALSRATLKTVYDTTYKYLSRYEPLFAIPERPPDRVASPYPKSPGVAGPAPPNDPPIQPEPGYFGCGAGDEENASVVRVFYATDRMQVVGKGDPRYDHGRSASGQISYGECAISIPRVHKLGKLETPSILWLEFSPDPEKHIVLKEVRNLEESIFLERVAASVAKSPAKEAFIFIHGYKVSFEDAARRTGQIAFDLHFVGAPIFYSWPSNGKLADYLKDETNITWSTPHFQTFLSLLSQHSGAKRIHIIAHSMGNRAVCDALKALSYDSNSNLKFNHLVLAAPDIDADTFRELAATLQRLSGRITLYESSKDKAIQASKKIHGNPRAGEPLLVIPGLDTIDASAIDTDFLGHSYFSDNWPLLSDIHSILFKDDPPAERFGLMEMQHPNGKYYAFRA